MQDSKPAATGAGERYAAQRRGRDLFEILVCYGLILSAIWTPRPVQGWFYWGAIAWVVLSTGISFAGWKAMGFRTAGFRRSLWVVGIALLLGAPAVLLAARLHTLHHPSGFVHWIKAFLGYVLWSFVQQFLLQGYFLLRLARVLPTSRWAAITAAVIFAAAHLPNPILTPMTLLWGLCACFLFLRFRNIYPLAMAHAIFGICIAITLPAPLVHDMRVGLGYLRYRAPQHLHLSQSDQRVSTVAWVMAEAPTRRSARQALP